MYKVLITAIIVIGVYYLFKHYAQGGNLMNSDAAKKTYAKVFKLRPGEMVIKQASGHVDPNSHVSLKKTAVKAVLGTQLKSFRVFELVLTDQNRFIISQIGYEPVQFDKDHLPKITDTGQAGRFSKIPGAGQQEGRILKVESLLIPELMIPENADVLEISVPQDFIPEIMNWVKKNKAY